MNVKDGWKTSEFWVSLITALCGVCIIFGVFNTNDINDFLQAAEKLAGSLMALISTVVYTFSRTKIKQNNDDKRVIAEIEPDCENEIEASKVDSGFPFRMED